MKIISHVTIRRTVVEFLWVVHSDHASIWHITKIWHLKDNGVTSLTFELLAENWQLGYYSCTKKYSHQFWFSTLFLVPSQEHIQDRKANAFT